MLKRPTYEELKQQVKELQEEAAAQRRRLEESQGRIIELGQSNQELNHLVSQIAHELQEPLCAVRRYLQFVDARYKDRIDPDAAAFIGSAVDGADKMQELITKLLACLRRRESGGDAFEPNKRAHSP